MNYFDNLLTEEELKKIKKLDCLYSKDNISLDDKKNRKLLDFYVYQKYLKNISNENTEDKKGGASCE